MQMISAALAFAVTMLALALLVSTLVETIHRTFGMRERGLYYMLGRLYEGVLHRYDPRVSPSSPGQPGPFDQQETLEGLKRAFQDRMSQNRSPVAVTEPSGPARTYPVESLWSLLFPWRSEAWRGRGLSELTAAGFMERLGSHPIGDGIDRAAREGRDIPAASAGDPVDAVLQGVVQKFEAYAKEASVFFERRARTLSIAVAFVVAFVLHVDAIDIFKSFVRDPALAERVIGRVDTYTKAFEAAKADQEKKGANPLVAPSAADLQDFQRAAQAVEQLRKEYASAVANLKTVQTDLSDLGVPIGWSDERRKAAGFRMRTRPVCEPSGKRPVDGKCEEGEKLGIRKGYRTVDIPRDAMTIVGLLLGGLLVGLGGPFWYDMVKNLTSIRNVFRGQSTPAPTTGGSAGVDSPDTGAVKETPQPRTPVDIFKAARAAWIAAGKPTDEDEWDGAVRPSFA
jgi:hypothetical protein